MTKITVTRDRAIEAIAEYMMALKEGDYNTRCIRDSVVVMSLDAYELHK